LDLVDVDHDARAPTGDGVEEVERWATAAVALAAHAVSVEAAAAERGDERRAGVQDGEEREGKAGRGGDGGDGEHFADEEKASGSLSGTCGVLEKGDKVVGPLSFDERGDLSGIFYNIPHFTLILYYLPCDHHM
jgi:hypothetical protein